MESPCSAGQRSNPLPHLLVTRVRVHRCGERRHMPREPLRQDEVSRQSGVNRDPHAPGGVESLWEGESKGSLLRGTGPATVDSPRQVTAIRVAALNRDDAKQNRGLPLLHGHRALPQVLWHRDACDSETGAEIGAPRRMQNLRGFRKMRALSRDREKTAAGISRLQQRNPRMPCHSSSSDGCV